MSLQTVKAGLSLGQLSSRFFDFLAAFLGLNENHSDEFILRQLAPWFSKNDDLGPEDSGMEVFSQYVAEYVHQKYRLALEFCAEEAGFPNVIVYDPDTLHAESGCLFWFSGCHPEAVHWIMVDASRVVTKGTEPPNSLNIDTLEDWLLERIGKFIEIGKTANDR